MLSLCPSGLFSDQKAPTFILKSNIMITTTANTTGFFLVRGILLSVPILSHLNLRATHRDRDGYSIHFTDEETEVWRG